MKIFGRPKVTNKDIDKLKESSENIKERARAFEKAVMDGESMWMLVKCPAEQSPVCIEKEKIPKLQERLKRCSQT